MYVYNEELPCGPTPPHYQLFKSGDGFSIHTCKTKSTRNPLYRWVVGEGGISEFAFSPCCKYLAVAGQDGYLRVFNYDSMELVGLMKSYFGGLLCVCWSPDSRYIVVGGEDDLVTVWSLHEKRVICRGQGHRSWVNAVAFDPYTTSYMEEDGMPDFMGSDDDFVHNGGRPSNLLQEALRASVHSNTSKTSGKSASEQGALSPNIVSYRFGSVGQDTQLCLWDLTEDVLRQPFGRHRTSTIISHSAFPMPNLVPNSTMGHGLSNSVPHKDSNSVDISSHHHNTSHNTPSSSSFTQKFATLALGERGKDKDDKKDHKRNFSLGSRSGDKLPVVKANHSKGDDAIRLLGTMACPQMLDVPLLEALVCKKVAMERLTALVFREECIVMACQEGFVYTWARPGKVVRILRNVFSAEFRLDFLFLLDL